MNDDKPQPQFGFTDDAGRHWNLRLNLNSMEEIDDTLGLNLATLEGQVKAFDALVADYRKLKAFLWILCERQADARNVTPAEFGASIDGDVIAQLQPALEGLILNFTQAQNRDVVALAKAKRQELLGAGVDQMADLASGEIKQEFLARQKLATMKKVREDLDSVFGD